jgi:hypothetical protein
MELNLSIRYDRAENEFSIYSTSVGGMYKFNMANSKSLKDIVSLRDEADVYLGNIKYDTLQAFAASTKLNYLKLFLEDNNDIILLESNWTLDEFVNIKMYERTTMKVA